MRVLARTTILGDNDARWCASSELPPAANFDYTNESVFSRENGVRASLRPVKSPSIALLKYKRNKFHMSLKHARELIVERFIAVDSNPIPARRGNIPKSNNLLLFYPQRYGGLV